jgi:hypothetical protein
MAFGDALDSDVRLLVCFDTVGSLPLIAFDVLERPWLSGNRKGRFSKAPMCLSTGNTLGTARTPWQDAFQIPYFLSDSK